MLALSLGACSAIKLGYNQLPDISYWWLDGYVDVREPQVTRLRDEIARLHAWHRQTELPRYASLLDNLALLATGPARVLTCDTVPHASNEISVVEPMARALRELMEETAP